MVDVAVLERVSEILKEKKLLFLARGREGSLRVELMGTPGKWAGEEIPDLVVKEVKELGDIPDARTCLEIVFENGRSLEFFVLGGAQGECWYNWISVLFCSKELVPAQNHVLFDTHNKMKDGEFYEFVFDNGSKIVVKKKWAQGLDLSWATDLFIIFRPSRGGSVELVRITEE